MRLDLVRFLESVPNEQIAAKLFMWMNYDGLFEVFNLIEFTNEETKQMFLNAYRNRFEYALTDAKNRGERIDQI